MFYDENSSDLITTRINLVQRVIPIIHLSELDEIDLEEEFLYSLRENHKLVLGDKNFNIANSLNNFNKYFHSTEDKMELMLIAMWIFDLRNVFSKMENPKSFIYAQLNTLYFIDRFFKNIFPDFNINYLYKINIMFFDKEIEDDEEDGEEKIVYREMADKSKIYCNTYDKIKNKINYLYDNSDFEFEYMKISFPYMEQQHVVYNGIFEQLGIDKNSLKDFIDDDYKKMAKFIMNYDSYFLFKYIT